MLSYDKLVRPEVFRLSPYIPGKPADEVKRELGLERVIKLASNENPLGPSPRAIERVREMAARAHIYPDASAWALKQELASRYGVPESQIILGNGSDEILILLGQTFISPGDEAVMPAPSFPVYRTSVLLAGGTPVEVPLKDGFLDLPAMAEKINEKTKMVFICNPNNPTGAMVSRTEVDQFMKKIPEGVLVVADEAYYEYVSDPDYGDLLPYLKQGFPVIVLHTFSKIYGLAGLRVGYGLVPEDVQAFFNRVRLSFNVNSLAQAAALAALSDQEHVERSRRVNEEGKAYLQAEFRKIGLKVYRTWGNFIMVDTGRDCQAVFQQLLREGVIVRPTSAWGLMTCLRITIGSPSENEILVRALRNVLA